MLDDKGVPRPDNDASRVGAVLTDGSSIYYEELYDPAIVAENGCPLRWIRRSIATGEKVTLADNENSCATGQTPVLSGDMLFWAHGVSDVEGYRVDSIRGVSIRGGAVRTVVTIGPERGVDFAADGSTIYWLDHSRNCAWNGKVCAFSGAALFAQHSLRGGPTNRPAVPLSGFDTFVASDDSVYMRSTSAGIDMLSRLTLDDAGSPAATRTTVFDGPKDHFSIRRGRIYWAERSRFMSARLDGSDPQEIVGDIDTRDAAGKTRLTDMTTDGSHLYWWDSSNTVYRVPLRTSAPSKPEVLISCDGSKSSMPSRLLHSIALGAHRAFFEFAGSLWSAPLENAPIP